MNENTFRPGQLYIIKSAVNLSLYSLEDEYLFCDKDVLLCLTSKIKLGYKHNIQQLQITFLDKNNKIIKFRYPIPNDYVHLGEL